MGLKKNNPGCNCCGDVLLWNKDNQYWTTVTLTQGLGAPITVNVGGGSGGWYKLEFSNFKAAMNEIGAKVDEVTRDNPDNWTGNIHDYKLIVWPIPNRASDCGALVPECNSPTPEWWEEVNGGNGGFVPPPTWSGRIVLAYDIIHVETARDENWQPRPFENNITVVPTSPTFEDGISYSFFQNDSLDVSWPTAGSLVHAIPAREGITGVPLNSLDHLMEGVGSITFWGGVSVNGGTNLCQVIFTSESSGNEVVVDAIREARRTGVDEDDNPFEQSRVVIGDTSVLTDFLGPSNDQSNQGFWKNLFRKPVFPDNN